MKLYMKEKVEFLHSNWQQQQLTNVHDRNVSLVNSVLTVERNPFEIYIKQRDCSLFWYFFSRSLNKAWFAWLSGSWGWRLKWQSTCQKFIWLVVIYSGSLIIKIFVQISQTSAVSSMCTRASGSGKCVYLFYLSRTSIYICETVLTV